MPEEFAINRYTHADRAEVMALVGAAVSANYARHLDRIWSWKYDSHPLNCEMEQERKENRPKLLADLESTGLAPVVANWGIATDELPPDRYGAPYILLLKAGNRIAAIMGCLPQAFLIEGRRFLVSAGCDMAVHPDYRGKSLSMRVSTRMALDHGLTLGWSNETSRRVGERFARRTMRQWRSKTTVSWGRMRVVALVKPIDWSYIVQRTTNVNLPGNVAASGGRRCATVSNPSVRSRPAFGKHRDIPASSLSTSVSTSYGGGLARAPVIAVRDSAYLNWRFNSRPDATT